ncbi:hypothetical protein HRG_002852 [Hirsutella rhossiliensis]|uniref:PD-(D/E)XK nuclease-like domain-containing protein n=1 Tax=Hirsutella rhossiliensis TaxID=111463 RepID=A0A9P8SL68_9HYPO|nr:uncharacterized protein HRG_02852 [Hirsutella rhossiliensis]KAH0964836.1 hypothetical protein HRG_02852 [Hirsutella rhossiliensis]
MSMDSPSRKSTSSYASSGVSRNSSPRKQLRNASLQSTGFRQASFPVDGAQLPPSLRTLSQDLKRIRRGVAILPTRLRHELAAFQFPIDAFSDNEETTRLRYPPIDFVGRIDRRAAECDMDCEGESSWNADVHAPLLDWVLRRDPNGLLLDFRYCTNAALIPQYKPKEAPGKMVDFCLAIRPNKEEQRVIDDLCRTRPDLSINHTEWGNLSKHPIAISIETKHQGGDSAVALLRMATWHSAQWRSLRLGNSDEERARLALQFLPGIIVQGHDWKFVATTLGEDFMATTFKSLSMGTTESIPDIYQLAVSLQRLKVWAEEEYWPAFKATILGF